MKTYTDNTILNIKYLKVDYSNPIITAPFGYEEIREVSSIVEHDEKLIWLTTCVKKVDNINVYSIHRFESSVDDDKNWEYKGKLSMKGQGGVEIECEDPTFTITPTGEVHLLCENKSYEKEFGMFVVSKFIATDWDSPFMFQGGSTGISPFGVNAKAAVYSPEYIDKYTDPIHFDGRTTLHEENVFWADWKDGIYIPDLEPIFTVNDISQPIKSQDDSKVVTTGIGGSPYKIKKKNGSIWYVMKIVAYKDWSHKIWLKGRTDLYNGYWCQGFAISKSLRSGWEELNSEIKDQDGKNLQFSLFYSNGWKALVSKSNKIYLAGIVTDNADNGHDLSEHINNDPSLPHHSLTVADNVLIMRVLKPDLEEKIQEAINNGFAKVTEQELFYWIDLIDEIS